MTFASIRPPLSDIVRPIAVAVAVMAVNVIGIWIPAPWRDEAATWFSTQRTDAELWSLLEHADAVHGMYYFIIRWWAHAFGDSAFSLRSFSVLGVGVGAALVSILARKMFGSVGATFAGLCYGLLPPITWAASEARSYAWVAAVAVALVLAFWTATTRSGWYRWVGYAVLVAFATYLFLFLLLVPLALLIALPWLDPPQRPPALASTVVGTALTTTILIIATRQSTQVGWLASYPTDAVTILIEPLWGGQLISRAGGSVLLIVLLVFAVRHWRQRQHRKELAMLIGWLVIPEALLLIAYPIKQLFHPRYLILSVPAVAALTPLLTSKLRSGWPRLTAAAIMMAAMVPSFIATRGPSRLGLAPTAAVAYLKANYQPGDALYLYGKDVGGLRWAFPDVIPTFKPVGLEPTGWQGQLIYQPSFMAAGIGPALVGVERVWVWGDRGEFGASISDFTHLGFTQKTTFQGDDRFSTTLVLMER